MTGEQADDGPLGWCVVANVAAEIATGEGGLEIRRGTKRFAPGARVWVTRSRWDPGHDRTYVVGRHRGGNARHVRTVVCVDELENFRVRGIHSPRLLRALLGLPRDPAAPLPDERPWASREQAQEYAAMWDRRLDPARIDGEDHLFLGVPNPPPLEIEHEGRTLYLAHLNARYTRYSALPPPVEYVPDGP